MINRIDRIRKATNIKNLKTIKQIKNISYSQMNKFILVLGVVFFVFFAIRYIHKEAIIILPPTVYSIISGIVTFLSAYFIASLFIRFTLSLFLRFFKHQDIEQKLLVTKLYGFVVYIITTVLVLWVVGVNVQNITLFLGLITTGLAFALREILLNYMIWFMFLTKRPFRIGDHIKIDNYEGKVQHIGTFYVILDDSPDDTADFVRVPNKIFIEKAIINYGKAPFTFSFSYPLFRDVNIKSISIVEKKISELGVPLTFELVADDISVKVVVSGKTNTYDERNALRDKVLRIFVEHMPFKS